MQTYSIADLEKLSGIKSHTIRIWEKRYNIVSPERSDTNIRAYNDDQLKKILNISFLINNGLKISKIASLSLDELSSKVISLTSNSASFEAQINDFVICSLQFDEPLFNRTYDSLRQDYSLSFVYENVFIPTLRRIGALWSSRKNNIKELSIKSSFELKSIKPLFFDAYYISMLSARKSGSSTVSGFLYGLISNFKAKKSGEYSSLMYFLFK